MAKNVKKGPAQLRPGKAGVSGAVKKGGGKPMTGDARAEDPSRSVGGGSHVPTVDVAARKALKAIGAALKGLHGLTSEAQLAVDSAVREAEGL